MKRRDFLAASVAALAAPAVATAQDARVLRFIPQTDLTLLDPIFSGVYATRTHAYMIYDTLYGQDSSFQSSPQMAAGHVIEDSGKAWRITLRDGLKWHDGERVLARDCVASIKRWGKVDVFGQSLMAATDEVSAADDKTILFRLKKPFPLLAQALGKLPTLIPVMMPERLANTAPTTQVMEVVGSGPFRFLPDERVSGARVAYARNTDYVPCASGKCEWTAGPKVVHFDRVEWTTIPDATTAAASVQSGEQDWWEYATVDLIPLLKKTKNVKVTIQDTSGRMCFFKLNETLPPFNNPAIRRALVGAMNQSDYMISVAGDDPAMWRAPIGFFPPDTPMASGAGMEALTSPRDYDKVKRDLAAAGYNGEKIVYIGVTDPSFAAILSDVGADMLRKAGFNVDYQVADFGTMAKRRFNREAPDKGGWNCLMTALSGVDMLDPAVQTPLRANGASANYGWPNSPQLEALRDAWFDAPDLAGQQRIAADIQRQAFIDVPYIPAGQFLLATAYSTRLSDIVTGFTVFWNLKKT